MHELLCHGYQSISKDDDSEPRGDVDSDSAWTEGWMDGLAVLATEDWISRHIGEPQWVMTEAEELRTATRQASAERFEPQDNVER